MPRKMLLSDQTSKRLIKEVKKRECLWNPENERYSDRYQMAKSWMEIAEVMQLPEPRLRVKWKNLRDLFRKEIKRYGPVEQYSGKWRHFDMMKFIDVPHRNKKGNDESSIEAIEDFNNDEDDEQLAFVVEDEQEQEQEQEGNNEVYIDETYEEDPIPEKRAKLIDEDYDVMFLKSLAPYFKQLDPIRKLVVRSKMQDMLLNEIAAQTSATMFQSKKS